MAVHDFSSQRLFLHGALQPGVRIACTPEQANYLLNVLRLQSADSILVFNGQDGEFRALIEREGKRGAQLLIGEQTRAQQDGPDLHYLFAPLKRTRLDYMVQKATELGVSKLAPVLTRRTIAERVNVERLRANTIEAAEQCGILRVPDVCAPQKLDRVLSDWNPARQIIFCDEHATVSDPIHVLHARFGGGCSAPSLAVLIGPEGGFDASEREQILSCPFTVSISLGPRIMRADTAAVAALAVLNAAIGDWR